MIAISIVGFVKGEPLKLVAGMDADGNICGSSPAVKDYDKVYYMRRSDKSFAEGAVCVKECPEQSSAASVQCHPTEQITTCEITNDAQFMGGYATHDILGYCVPTNLTEIGDEAKNAWNTLQQNQALSTFWKDMQIASTAIYVSLGLALVYTLIYLYAMSNCAHVLAYIAIGLLELLFVAGMGGALYGVSKSSGSDANGFWITFAAIAVAFLIFNCLMWCYWTKLQVAIAVIDATADFMVATKRVALVTIWYFFLTIITVLIWGFGLIGVIAINEVTPK